MARYFAPVSGALVALLLSGAVGGCATTGGEGAPSGARATVRGIDRHTRATIGREDALTQMSFWAKENAANPDDVEAAAKFSDALRRGGQHDRALEVAAEGLARSPGARALTRAKGLALAAAGRGLEAAPLLQTVAESDAKDWAVRSALGVAYDEAGRPQAAREAYRAAMAIKSDDVATLTNLGVSYLLTGDAQQAEIILRQASALPDATAETRQNLSLAIGLQGRFTEAETLQRVDLPPAIVANNMAYMRSLLVDERRWGDLTPTTKSSSADR